MGKQLGVRCSFRGKVSHDECRLCSLAPTHPCAYSPAMLEVMRADNDRYEGTTFTLSKLLECDRRTALYTSRDHWLSPDNDWGLHRGHAFHHYLEELNYPPGSVHSLIKEQRFKAEVQTTNGSREITGKMDLVVVRERKLEVRGNISEWVAYCTVVDYKTKNDISHSFTFPDMKHEMQLNMYAWILENGIMISEQESLASYVGAARLVVDTLELYYMSMKKTRRFTSEVKLSADGVKHRGASEPEQLTLEPIRVMDREAIHDWIARRIAEKEQAEVQLPLRLTGDESKLCSYCPMYEVCYSLPD